MNKIVDTMDWTQCIICQQITQEMLRCPLNTRGDGDQSKVYNSFLDNVCEFNKLNQLPVPLKFGEDIDVDKLVAHEAKWHKSCYLKFNDSKLQRARKREADRNIDSGSSSQKRSRVQRQSLDKDKCIFCSRNDGPLHEFRTFDADDNVRRMAIELQDTALLTRIEGGDLTALEAKYHLSCLTALRNRYRSLLRQRQCFSSDREEEKVEARAFVELINHVENSIENGTFCFKFSVLRQMFESRLHDLGITKEINKVRFKERVLNYFPNAQEQNDGKNVILVFEEGMQQMLKTSMECNNYQEDALTLMRAAKIVRNEVFSSSGFVFNASFPVGCQQQSVPYSLNLLVTLLLQGGDIVDQCSSDSQPCLTIAQLVLFNCKKSVKKDASLKSRHSLSYEPPMPLYLGLNLHTQTRSKKVITELYELGLSVSYNRVLQIEKQLAFAVCEDFRKKGVVCPAQLRKGLFTVAALDNLDHNPSSTTAKGSFHGTGISLFQCPTSMNIGIPQEKLTLALSKESEKCDLPECFTIVPAVALTKEKVAIPEPPRSIQRIEGNLNQAVAQEKQWINNSIAMLMETEQMEGKDIIAWSTYHASQEIPSDVTQPALMQLLPLFGEKAATAAMVKHGMSIIKQATQYLNPGQVSVIALDAPLFALAKLVQWNWPQTHGEDLFVVMFGGLHIEMALWKTFGDYLESSGWTNALVQAGITSSGAADSFLKASHLTRTRHAHQVSALALSKLQHEAFLQSEGPHDESTKEAWREEAITKSPTFQFWDTILKTELLGLIFVRAHRQRKFSFYVESLKDIAPWFFALDHHNYARWIPVHIRDTECLPSSVYEQFEECGHWVVQKTTNRFSAMPIDQCHEQNNETVKGSGGAVGLTENPAAFRRWMTAGPEQARLLKEFECEFMKEASAKQLHHEEGFSTQKAFKEQTQSLVDAINEMGNPFLHDSADLVVLDSRDILDNTVVSTVRRVEKHGLEQYNMYYETVIKDRNASIHNAIRKNSFPLFSRPAPKIKSKQAEQISMLKHDVELFSRLYIVMQHRDCDMATFFQHENHPYPPSLSDRGKLRLGKKSDLLGVLPIETDKDPPVVFDVKVLDGAAIVHFLSTTGISTFDEYAGNVFMPYIKKQLEASTRVDVVWDTYITCSLKESTREKRGKGMRREVTGRNKFPRNWIDFLQNSENKQQLFSFLSHKLASMECVEGKQVIVTTGTSVAPASINRMQPCNHEEADTRMVVHLVDALDNGATTCFVRTVDTDVVTIIAGKFHDLLQKHPAADLWLGFGVGKTFRHIHINAMCNVLGREKSVALPIFHAFTGCDTTSAFFSKGKKSAWEAWKSFPEVTGAFLYVASHPHIPITTHCEHFKLLERFCVILYDKTSSLQSVDEARKELFCQKNRTMELIPPTQNALLQHCNRVIYQAGIWSNSNITNPDLPSPEEYGWKLSQETKWCPVWITLPVASKACTELVKCNCKSSNGCGGRCSCKKAQWKCTQLCTCNCEK